MESFVPKVSHGWSTLQEPHRYATRLLIGDSDAKTEARQDLTAVRRTRPAHDASDAWVHLHSSEPATGRGNSMPSPGEA